MTTKGALRHSTRSTESSRSTDAIKCRRDELAELVACLDPRAVPASEAPAVWRAFDEIERLASSAKTLLAARVEESREWKRQGFRSAAEQLARQSGTTVSDAKASLDVSRRLDRLPATQEALRSGTISARQAVAVAGAAVADRDAERRLLETARSSSVAELREECLRTRAAADTDPDATHRRIAGRRHLRQYTDGEGAWNLSARGTAEMGARVNAALEPIIDEIFADRRRGEDTERESREAYAFDALVALADRFVESNNEVNGLPDGPGGAGKAAKPRYLALIRADLAALTRGRVEGEETCEIAGLGPVPARIARDLLGESVVKLVLTKGVDVANVTHVGRGPTAAQRVALAWRQPACTVAGCSRTRVEIDHRDEYCTTRTTRLDSLDPLCKHHHDLKTYDDWALVKGCGKREMVPPDDDRHPRPRRGARRRSPPPTDPP